MTIQDLKEIVEREGWTGFVLTKNGACWFKNVPFNVTQEKCKKQNGVVALHVLSKHRSTTPKEGGSW